MSEKYVQANGIQLAYDEFGDPSHPVILLIMGLGTQMIAWPEEFCAGLAARGYRVIRFDNRDIGLSEKMEGARVPGPLRVAGRPRARVAAGSEGQGLPHPAWPSPYARGFASRALARRRW